MSLVACHRYHLKEFGDLTAPSAGYAPFTQRRQKKREMHEVASFAFLRSHQQQPTLAALNKWDSPWFSWAQGSGDIEGHQATRTAPGWECPKSAAGCWPPFACRRKKVQTAQALRWWSRDDNRLRRLNQAEPYTRQLFFAKQWAPSHFSNPCFFTSFTHPISPMMIHSHTCYGVIWLITEANNKKSDRYN